MFLLPMTEASYWRIGLAILAIILIGSVIGLFIGNVKTHNSFNGFVSGLQYGFIFLDAVLYAHFPLFKIERKFHDILPYLATNHLPDQYAWTLFTVKSNS